MRVDLFRTVKMKWLIAIFGFGLLLAACRDNCGCPNDSHVSVQFTNNTNSAIDSIRVYVGPGKLGTADVVAAFDDNVCICFESPGENEFSVSATFDDGKVVASKEYYSEGEYRFRAIVKAEAIYLGHESNY